MSDKVERVRQLLARKMKKMKRLNAVFEKLDLDQNGMLSKKEFGVLVADRSQLWDAPYRKLDWVDVASILREARAL